MRAIIRIIADYGLFPPPQHVRSTASRVKVADRSSNLFSSQGANEMPNGGPGGATAPWQFELKVVFGGKQDLDEHRVSHTHASTQIARMGGLMRAAMHPYVLLKKQKDQFPSKACIARLAPTSLASTRLRCAVDKRILRDRSPWSITAVISSAVRSRPDGDTMRETAYRFRLRMPAFSMFLDT